MTLKTLEKAVQRLKLEEQRKLLRDLPALINLSLDDSVTAKLNKIYVHTTSKLDSKLKKLQTRTIYQ
jgi:hypothetical protein